MAGFFLNQRWPERYPFDLSATLAVRNQQRLECQNVWRRRHDLPEIVPPPAQTNRLAATEAVKVTAIVWETGSAKPTDDFAARIGALRGKLLSAPDITEVLGRFVAQPEPGTEGLTFSARKEADLSGVTLVVCLLPAGPADAKPTFHISESVSLADNVIYGTSGTESRGEAGFYGQNGVGWNDFIRAINTAVGSSPETPFVISAKVEKTIYL
jgi:hypothetical protein